jgi:hypothetical protein
MKIENLIKKEEVWRRGIWFSLVVVVLGGG